MTDIEATFGSFFSTEKAIHDYFGYVENWAKIPLEDAREMHWKINGGESHGGTIVFHEEREDVLNGVVEHVVGDGQHQERPQTVDLRGNAVSDGGQPVVRHRRGPCGGGPVDWVRQRQSPPRVHRV